MEIKVIIEGLEPLAKSIEKLADALGGGPVTNVVNMTAPKAKKAVAVVEADEPEVQLAKKDHYLRDTKTGEVWTVLKGDPLDDPRQEHSTFITKEEYEQEAEKWNLSEKADEEPVESPEDEGDEPNLAKKNMWFHKPSTDEYIAVKKGEEMPSEEELEDMTTVTRKVYTEGLKAQKEQEQPSEEPDEQGEIVEEGNISIADLQRAVVGYVKGGADANEKNARKNAVRELLSKHGHSKVSEVPEGEVNEVYNEVMAL